MQVSIQEIRYRGLAVAIFLVLCAASAFFAMGVLTPNWSREMRSKGDLREGLFERCTCRELDTAGEDWFQTARAFVLIGGIGIASCIVLIAAYLALYPHVKKMLTILMIISNIATVVILLIGLVVYAINKEELHYSFGLTVVSIFFCTVAAIMVLIQQQQQQLTVVEVKPEDVTQTAVAVKKNGVAVTKTGVPVNKTGVAVTKTGVPVNKTAVAANRTAVAK